MNNQDNIQQEYIEWEDHFQTTKEKVHLTYNELKIPVYDFSVCFIL